jgi:DNA-binding IclR family transcriptional regulator
MSYIVEAVDEAIKLLFIVAAEPGLGVTEIARRSGNTKARAFRLLSTLEARDLVRRQGPAATYALGLQALHLGAAARGQIDLVRLADEPIAALGAELNETIALRVRDGLETVCVARWESTHSLRVHGEVGHRRPLHAGASSKLLLAFAPEEVIAQVLADERKRYTPSTPVSKTALLAEIESIRMQGHAVSVGERAPDTAAVAVPIVDAEGEVVAALSASAPATRLSGDRVPKVLQALRRQAAAISKGLGFPGVLKA